MSYQFSFDIEDNTQNSLSKQDKTNICKAFGEIVQNAGYKVGYILQNIGL